MEKLKKKSNQKIKLNL